VSIPPLVSRVASDEDVAAHSPGGPEADANAKDKAADDEEVEVEVVGV
jgi:hypothetical protein